MATKPALPSSASALAALQSYDKSRQKPSDVLNESMNTYGVPGMQSGVSTLRTSIDNTANSLKGVESSVTGRTSGSMVTEAQRAALVNRESQPILQNYNDLTGKLNTQTADLQSAQQLASALANANITEQGTQYSHLKDTYDASLANEAELQRRKEQAAKDREDMRQFNAQMALEDKKFQLEMKKYNEAARAAASGLSLGSLGGGGGSGGGSKGASAKMSQRASDKGFNFAVNGKSVSAATYAQLTGKSFRSVLQTMANKGDYGAKQALQFVGDDYGVNLNKLKGYESYTHSNYVRNVINSLLWGVNRV